MLTKYHRTDGLVVNDIAVYAGDSRFGLRAAEIEHSVANGSPPLQRFCSLLLKCCAAEMGFATRYELLRNAVSVTNSGVTTGEGGLGGYNLPSLSLKCRHTSLFF